MAEWSAANPTRRVTKVWVHDTMKDIATYQQGSWRVLPEVLARIEAAAGGEHATRPFCCRLAIC